MLIEKKCYFHKLKHIIKSMPDGRGVAYHKRVAL